MKKTISLLFLLFAPLMVLQVVHNLTAWSVLIHFLFSTVTVVLLSQAQSLKNKFRPIIKTTILIYYFLYLLLLLFEVILYDFTGRGFTNEVYFHFEFESLRIGFYEYPFHLVAFGLLVFVYIFLTQKLINRTQRPINFFITLVALLLICVATINSSMARFTHGLNNYLWQDPAQLNDNLTEQFIDLGVLQNDKITTKDQLSANSTRDSKNLILLYLESFNQGLLHLEQYPKLTPNLNKLSQNYQNLNHLSSSYVTIAGIISSQCGAMLPMTAGNNTFLTEGQLLSKMPCLGDVLKQAGYTQYYLGGAQTNFAGKGKFLEAHGYDYIWGLEHWKANGLRETKGIWGLSDTQLFKYALANIKKAALTPPYNMTLLTLGTHTPGYMYEGCKPYEGSDEAFINAIHCTDQLVGQFVDELEKNQLLDNTLLMIVADHGVFPSVKMKELFAEEVDNRQLIGITNYHPIPDVQLSSYDLAPTILDMLKIEHNANFLFGQSVFSKTKNQQKYVTRITDWLNDKMVLNPKGECKEGSTPGWPLSECYKKQLLGLTNHLLALYSTKDEPEPLSCKLNVKFVTTKDKHNRSQFSLLLNENNHFDHFYHKGHLLKTLKISSGVFVFILNDHYAIEKHIYFSDLESARAQIDPMINSGDNPVLVIEVQTNSNESTLQSNPFELQIEYFQQMASQWLKETKTSDMSDLVLCNFSTEVPSSGIQNSVSILKN